MAVPVRVELDQVVDAFPATEVAVRDLPQAHRLASSGRSDDEELVVCGAPATAARGVQYGAVRSERRCAQRGGGGERQRLGKPCLPGQDQGYTRSQAGAPDRDDELDDERHDDRQDDGRGERGEHDAAPHPRPADPHPDRRGRQHEHGKETGDRFPSLPASTPLQPVDDTQPGDESGPSRCSDNEQRRTTGDQHEGSEQPDRGHCAATFPARPVTSRASGAARSRADRIKGEAASRPDHSPASIPAPSGS